MQHHTRPPVRSLLAATAAVLAVCLSSCVQPPAPKTYNPAVASHLRQLSHDEPVTPIPAAYGGWGYCYSPYWGHCY
jgi:hypothetical protein